MMAGFHGGSAGTFLGESKWKNWMSRSKNEDELGRW